jgi:hypothetical protein
MTTFNGLALALIAAGSGNTYRCSMPRTSMYLEKKLFHVRARDFSRVRATTFAAALLARMHSVASSQASTAVWNAARPLRVSR